ncbi:redoxin domain-containing protein [Calothrix sp. NIES-4071]|nr:redoxin domain-containing protein [Calothrix sp. NIES-4071]BAZ57769.1 redoxin domain-containing protein [Calothrix sp. NIES-4105]
MNLTQELQNLLNHVASQVPAETLSTIGQSTQQVADLKIDQKALKVGERVSNFSLPGATGQLVELQQLLAKGPVVIAFYRGEWCPFCNLELRALQNASPEIKALGASLVAISPQTPDNSLSTSEKHSLTFEVLSDVGNKVAKQFGLVYTVGEVMRAVMASFGTDLSASNGDDSFELPLPATYVIDTDGAVTFRFIDADFTKRLDPAEIITALSNLQTNAVAY